MSDGNTNAMASFLKDHPRMIGVLFTLMLALTQAGNAAAACGATID